MIRGFRDKEAQAIWQGQFSRKLPQDIQGLARRKLRMLDAAIDLRALMVPPSNRLEVLRGDRRGQWSIRINDQWRICFRWEGADAREVEVVDYH